MIEWKITNSITFVNKFKFKTEFKLKFLKAKLLLNLDQIYWGFKLVWKNLINFSKFLFALAFHIVNLDWHDCMVKFEVSIHALLGLGLKENEKSV
jgi:hypothetical protein